MVGVFKKVLQPERRIDAAAFLQTRNAVTTSLQPYKNKPGS